MADEARIVDVAIVGAGPTGLMAAALLLRQGLRVRLLDKSPDQAHESRAFGIQARSMELFRSIGLAERVLEEGTVASGARLYVDGREAAAFDIGDIGREDTPFSFLLMLPQDRIEAILNADVAAHGLTVERGVTVETLAQDAAGVTLSARDASGAATTIRAAYVIGADGAHSVVRKALGLGFAGAAYPQGFLLADCRVEWGLSHDRLILFTKGRRFAAFLPIRGKALSRLVVVAEAESDREAGVEHQGAGPATLEEVQDAVLAATGVDLALAEPKWLSRYRIHHRGVDRYGVGRTFVAGDAAHIHSPAGGQGMNTGLQDAANLAWKLAAVVKGGAPMALLDSYHAERWPVGQRVLEQTDRMFSNMTTQSAFKAAVRNTLLPLFAGALSRSGAVRARAFHFLSQLGIRYEPGTDIVEATGRSAGHAWRHGPSAGRRAPDGRIAGHRTVFDLIAGYGFHILAFAREPLEEDALARLRAALDAIPAIGGAKPSAHIVAQTVAGRDRRVERIEANEVLRHYGIDHETPDGLYLVRPDGYVAWRQDGHDVEALTRFARERFGAG